ncbi:permease family protein [Marinobacter santoriniensis NKSG1]|uniref:Permease family protein n=1 Tax=Marinobacter santoriniensis NKSG1 TaxID=1288826 RepID=M7DI51_9GAMM|nr:hypothetical protein [Marinobacter santoriniensis]EMP57352.1 permease family protein [Marinobacter santoriniensis NKSG1]
MAKVLVLLLAVLLALASLAGYLLLNEKIPVWESQLAKGEKQLEEGRAALKEGRAELKAGEQALSEGKQAYEDAKNNLLLVLADKLTGGKGFDEGKQKIEAGGMAVARGERAVTAGERRLEAGALEISKGKELLDLARRTRVACGVGTVVFGALSIALGFFWRQSLGRSFRG